MYRKILAMLLAFAMVFALGVSAYADDEEMTADPLEYELGDHVDDFTVTLCDGTVFNLSEALATHKAVMINIWATWCNPCCSEMPVMQEAYADYADDIALVCLSAYDENDAINEFKTENGLEALPLGYDTVGLTDALVQDGYPTTIIVDRFGNYAYYECGSILDVGGFTRMWDYFISDDYTESEVVYEIPGPVYDGEYPTDEELSAALCADGSLAFTYDHEDEHLWPFMVTDNGVVNSNALVSASYASVSTTVTAVAGDVFAIDYAIDVQTLWDELDIYVDGEFVKEIPYTTEGTWAYEFTEAGDYEITFEYYELCSASETYGAGTVTLSNARLASGDEAAAILAAQPVYPFALEGDDFDIEILSEGAKRIELVFPEGMEEYSDYYSDIEMYIIPADTGKFRLLLGDAWDPMSAYGYGDCDSIPCICADTENDGEGYIFECELACVENGGYDNTYVSIFPDAADYYTGKTLYIFKNEENVNYFVQYDVYGDGDDPLEGITWTYEDGTLPSTDEVAHESNLYNIFVVDENGDPVDGVMINICDDDNCSPTMTSDGYYGFDGEAYPYVIHVLQIPDGYTFDTTQEFVFDAEGGDITITIPHA